MVVFCVVDDKYIPLFRVLWVAKTPHFCGEDDCEREGQYEIRLEDGETVWAQTQQERDEVLKQLEVWAIGEYGGDDADDSDEDAPEEP
ncbi:MAG: hypothetical protein PHE53_12910 [Thermoguttaceae bacterium]|nr:hypothetical protein [Thermoguttaceae bacterium]